LPLFEEGDTAPPSTEAFAPGAMLLRGFALPYAQQLLADVERIAAHSPFRHMETPGGFRMSVAITNCGALGWVTDRRGYRYAGLDPLTELPWPQMPDSFHALASSAAAAAGYAGFIADACLVNRYAIGARVTAHQDKNERDFTRPIVSVSLGLPAVFQFGGSERGGRMQRLALTHGDVAVWGGDSRMAYHAVMPIKDGEHPATGNVRINLTMRMAG
jgi:alkylated DNA repair protein (DNA oxidative demethylase)